MFNKWDITNSKWERSKFQIVAGKNKYKETLIFKLGTCDHPKLLEYVNPTQYFSSKKLAMGLFSVIIVN